MKQPGHQHTKAHSVYHGKYRTHQAPFTTLASTTLQRSPKMAARFLKGGPAVLPAAEELPAADRLIHHQQCPNQHNYRYLLRTRISQQTHFQIVRLPSRLYGDQRTLAHTQTQRATKSPPTPTPSLRETLPAVPLAFDNGCLQTTHSSRAVLLHF